MSPRKVRLACLLVLSACLLGGCTQAQLDFCPKGLGDPYGNTRP
ncbi:MAG: hypothetical protein ACYDD1_13335 [Caulobacteraceae bacterium]